MNHLVIVTHFNPKSFNHAIADRVIQNSETKGNTVKLVDLYAEGFNPVFNMPDVEFAFMGKEIPQDVKKHQDLVRWADHLTFIFPLWWAQMPAILKGWCDKILSSGFAFDYTKDGAVGLLKDKTASIYVTHGAAKQIFEQTKMYEGLDKVFVQGVFGFCGIETRSYYFASVTSVSNEIRQQYLNSVDI